MQKFTVYLSYEYEFIESHNFSLAYSQLQSNFLIFVSFLFNLYTF